MRTLAHCIHSTDRGPWPLQVELVATCRTIYTESLKDDRVLFSSTNLIPRNQWNRVPPLLGSAGRVITQRLRCIARHMGSVDKAPRPFQHGLVARSLFAGSFIDHKILLSAKGVSLKCLWNHLQTLPMQDQGVRWCDRFFGNRLTHISARGLSSVA